MKKVMEDTQSETYECFRCTEKLCNRCNASVEIDFDIDGKKDWKEGHGVGSVISKDDDVCPFCYNQLLEKYGGKNE